MTNTPDHRKLGRGLASLMAGIDGTKVQETASADAVAQVKVIRVPIASIVPNPDQPRRDFDVEALEGLAASLREKGLLQPLLVRNRDTKDRFEIVAGERRWRAAQLAGLTDVPVILRAFDDAEVLEVALIENIQRADLNPLEEAAAYRQLMDRFGHTQEHLARALSKSRSHIANLLRLLTLPEGVQALLRNGSLTMGHARALVTAHDPAALAASIVRDGLTVRDVEALMQAERSSVVPRATRALIHPVKSPDRLQMEQDLAARFGTQVSIDPAGKGTGGRIAISFDTEVALRRLVRLLTVGGSGPGA
jgi:ParB family transcriptional regulator, chromosome partitioning protein